MKKKKTLLPPSSEAVGGVRRTQEEEWLYRVHPIKIKSWSVMLDSKQTAWVECEGTFKMDFGMDTTTDSMVQSLTARLDKHLEEYLPKRIPFGEDVRMAIEGLENVGQGKVDDDDGAKETTIGFGGQWAVNFGCKMVLSEPDGGKPTLSVQCGGRGVGGIGIFPPPQDDNEL